MGFLKNILGAFVEFEEDKAQPSEQKNGSAKVLKSEVLPDKIKPANSDSEHVSSTMVMANHSSSSTEYQKHFEELLDEANKTNALFQGTDFKEFIDSKSDVEGIADEATRYRTAFNVLKRTGLTKDKLINTGREYLNVIEQDVKAFENVYTDQYKTKVERKEQQLQQKAHELQILTEKIEALNKEMKQMSQEILTSKNQLTTNKNAFMLAGEKIKQEIQSELQKINEYFS